MAAETALASHFCMKKKKKKKKKNRKQTIPSAGKQGDTLVRLVAAPRQTLMPVQALFHCLTPCATSSYCMVRGIPGHSLKDSAGVTSSIGKVFNQRAAD